MPVGPHLSEDLMDSNRAWHAMTVPESLAALEATTHGLTAEEAG